MGRGARSMGGRDGPAPTQCGQAECFDPLLRNCVACRLFRTPEPQPGPASPPAGAPHARPTLAAAPCARSPSPAPAAGDSSLAPRTALQPQESVRAGTGPAGALPLPGLLFGAPALLGLALALALLLVGLLSWRRRRRRGAPSPEAPEAPEGEPEAPLDNVSILSSGPLAATAPPVQPLLEDPDTTPPGHSVPVPATELGSTELVTTKTAGPEQL
ncbi:tumor necrosis factor receptor superfamily member 13C [Choloepus didactylus]|uniref:tumor necrosis factor receptor superfamily member 13C n=1 Tax=Choloepus didactylus TaxID=27675 RepID=UPI0018A05D61|nr:tumor necrosis factor receptor superfamily member 13C [Choloepus didactylus]